MGKNANKSLLNDRIDAHLYLNRSFYLRFAEHFLHFVPEVDTIIP